MLAAAQAESLRTGKPLTILAGEAHGDPVATLNNILLVQEAAKLGIHNVALEFPVVLKEPGEGERRNPEAMREFQRSLTMLAPSLFPEGAFHAIDSERLKPHPPGWSSTAEGMAQREVAMGANIDTIAQPSLAVVGSLHLRSLTEQLSGTHTVLAINTSPSAGDREKAEYLRHRPWDAQRLHFLHSSGNVVRLGDGIDLSQATTADIIRATMGEDGIQQAGKRGVVLEGDAGRAALQPEHNPGNIPILGEMHPGAVRATQGKNGFPQYSKETTETFQKIAQALGEGDGLGKFGPNGDGVDGKWGPYTDNTFKKICRDAGIDSNYVNLEGPPNAETLKLTEYISGVRAKKEAEREQSVRGAEEGGPGSDNAFRNADPSRPPDVRTAEQRAAAAGLAIG